MYLRIKESNQKKEKKKSDRAIKKLKKEGKVQSIAGFLVTKEEAEDSWITSKRDRFVAKRGRTRVSKKDVPPPPTTAPPAIQHSFSEDGKAKFWDPKFGWRAATGGVCTGGWKIPALRGGKILFVGYDTYLPRKLRATKS